MLKKSGVERVKTNIPGFDETIEGGLVKNSLNLIAGGPGSGKTLLCLQYIYNSIKDFNEAALIVSFDENRDSLKADALQMGWDFYELEKEKKCLFLNFDPFEDQNLKDVIKESIKKYNVKRVAIDSISVFMMALEGKPFRTRRELYRLYNLLKSLDCTVLVTAETIGDAPLDITNMNSLTSYGVIEFVADSVITLHNAGIGGESDRAIRIVKMRRTKHRMDPVPMMINNKGINVLSKS